MTTITVPITKELESFISDELRTGACDSKAHLVRYALLRLREERVLTRLNEAEADIKTGRVYKGNLEKLIRQF